MAYYEEFEKTYIVVAKDQGLIETLLVLVEAVQVFPISIDHLFELWPRHTADVAVGFPCVYDRVTP